MPYLLDTNVLSETAKTKPSTKVLRWLEENDSQLFVSVLTLGEIRKGIQLMDDSLQKRKKAELEKWFQRLEKWAASRLITIDAALMQHWGSYYATHQRQGKKLAIIDSLFAVTALHYGLTLVTRNEQDFTAEIPLLNPW